MYYLTVAVALVGALCLFDLVLSFGVIRRLRAHDELLRRLAPAATVPTGQRVGAFTARTTVGGSVSRDGGDALRLVGFFSPGCAPCAERIPEFCEYGERRRLPGLAIVVADDGSEPAYVSRLSAYADVVVEPTAGPVSTAFRVTSFPALCLLDADGNVLASGTTIADLPDLVPAVRAT